ncbi:MAG: pilus assembly protein PilP [Dehalococcoidia bacterium]
MAVSVAAGLQAAAVRPGRMANVGRFVSPLQVMAQQMDGTQEPSRYNAEGRRDPFESLIKEKPRDLPKPGPVCPDERSERPGDPLERFDLSTLKLMGIIWGGLGRRGIIRAPDGKGYFVTVGMYMGQNCGEIEAIEDDRLIIKEKHRNLEGNIVDKTLTIPLRRKEKQQG